MTTLENYLHKQGIDTYKAIIYKQVLNNFIKSLPHKKVYTPTDIKNYCDGSKTTSEQMKVLEKYLYLNFKIVSKDTGNNYKNTNIKSLVFPFLKYLDRKGYSKVTIQHYKDDLKIFIKFLDSIEVLNINEITPQVIQSFKERLYRQKNSKGKLYNINSQAKILGRTKYFFNYLIRDEYLAVNPCMNMTFPREMKIVSRNIFTRNEIENLLSFIPTDNVYGFIDRTMFELLYATGIRVGEFLNLQIKDLNLEDGLITVFEGKNKKDRVCFLTKISLRYLKVYLEEVRPKYLKKGVDSPYLFPAKSGVKQYKRWVSERIMRWRDILKINFPVSAHAFRRSFATHLLQEGVGVRYIQQMMGHDSIDSTIKYIKLNIEDLRNALLEFHPREEELAKKKIFFKED